MKMIFTKNIQMLNDRQRTSVPYFSSKNKTLLIYTVFVQIKSATWLQTKYTDFKESDYLRKCPLTTSIVLQKLFLTFH